MNISSASSSAKVSYAAPTGEPTQAQKDKFAAAAKKAGVNVKPGEKPSDADMEKLKKAGGLPQTSNGNVSNIKTSTIDIQA